MYIAMRNRIFELEAKTVHYIPFSRTSRKRPVDRAVLIDDYHCSGAQQHTHGHSLHSADTDVIHPSKRPAYHHISHHHPPHPEHMSPPLLGGADAGSSGIHSSHGYQQSTSYPSGYSPNACFSYHGSQSALHPSRYPRAIGRELDQYTRVSKVHQTMTDDRQDPDGHGANNTRASSFSVSVDRSPLGGRRLPIASGLPPAIQPRPILPNSDAPANVSGSRISQVSLQHTPLASQDFTLSTQASHMATVAAAAAAAQQRQSFHQRQHRAQQQAQSDYSRSYHLQKHMRMMDQRRATQLTQQKQRHQQQQHQMQLQLPVFKPIQRHYQPHQQMYSSTSTRTTPVLPLPQQGASQQQMHQQRLLQYHQQRQQVRVQQQARQLQYLRNRSLPIGSPAGSPRLSPSPAPSLEDTSLDLPSFANPASGKSTIKRPLECFNCMSLDSLSWRPRTTSDSLSSSLALDSAATGRSWPSRLTPADGGYLCNACTQYLQVHGHCRPVPPFRVNFLKKIHCRFKKALLEVRFQGWQDARVLEIGDHISPQDFQSIFEELDDITTEPEALTTAEKSKMSKPLATTTEEHGGRIVIRIEDSDDECTPLTVKSVPHSLLTASEIMKRAFQSEAAVGELFGRRWKTEPMVGYTLVHFGGSDRTRNGPHESDSAFVE